MPEPSSTNLTFTLSGDAVPRAWYNAAADLPFALPPPIHPGTRKPLEPADLSAIFPAELIAQEMSTERWIAIPDQIRDVYRLWRPTPLKRAARFEQALGTRCRIYYKDESTSPVGSHKVNTALAQAYYNKRAGIERLVTETGAGPVGHRLEFRVQRVRARMQGLHGQGELRPEALTADHDEDLGLGGLRVTLDRDRGGPGDPRPGSRLPRLAGDRDLGGRGRGRQGPQLELLRSGACSITCCCTRR